MSQDLAGDAALVTGGGRGIGRAIAEQLAAQGAAVTVVSRTTGQLADVVASIHKAGGRALAVAADVTQRADVERAVAAARREFGPISILVNCAGLPGPFGPLHVIDPDEWWHAQAVHVRGPLLFMNAVLPGMYECKGGRIINICSQAGILVTPGMSAYCVGKASEIRLTEHVDAEGKDKGVRAFAIQPGTIITDMMEQTMNSPEVKRWTPWALEFFGKITAEESAKSMQRCAGLAGMIAAGRYDALAGRYIDFDTDLDAKVREIEAAT